MAYTKLSELSELSYGNLSGSEFILASDNNTTYKMSVETLLSWAADNTDALSSALTNKIMDDVTNLVHANAIHFTAVPDENMQPGDSVSIVVNAGSSVHVRKALSGDKVVAIADDVCLTGILTTFVVSGVIRHFNAVSFLENSAVYFQNGNLTSTPDDSIAMQYVGRILDNTASGRILVNLESEDTIARNIQYTNTGTNVSGTNIQEAVTELSSRTLNTVRLKIANDSVVLNDVAVGEIVGNVAFVEDEAAVNVKNEYTCSLAADKVTVNFDGLDNLNGFWATLSYYAQV